VVLALIAICACFGRADASDRTAHRTIVALRGRDDAGLDALVAAQQDPASPDYRRWVTGSEFGRRFGAAPRDLKRVERWLRDGGCRVKRARGRQQVTCVGGLPGDVPATLRPLVEDVLDPATPLELQFNLTHDRLQPRTVDAVGTYMSPEDYAKFFGYSALHDAGIDGRDQTIGIVGASSVELADINAFRAHFSLGDLALTRAGNPPAMPPSMDAELEAVLDVSWAGAVAPGANIVLAVSSGGLVDAIGYLVNRSDISVISLSVVLIPGPSSRPFIRQALQLFRQAAAQGQTVLIASGDFGALLKVKPKRKRGVDPMTGSPFVTAVGGTTPIFSDPSAIVGYGNEVVWQDGQSASGGGRGRARRPSWQRGSATRTVPDVALPADSVYPIFFNGDPNVQCCIGGTSAAAPSWAGLVAMLNQLRGHRAGLVNPALYDLGRAQAKGGPAVFHDIVVGSSTTTLARGFPARPGYDLATGWGTPDVPALFAALP
jgi:subtilase family serine protease